LNHEHWKVLKDKLTGAHRRLLPVAFGCPGLRVGDVDEMGHDDQARANKENQGCILDVVYVSIVITDEFRIS